MLYRNYIAIDFDEISLKLYTNCTIKYMVYIHVSSTKVNDSMEGYFLMSLHTHPSLPTVPY